MWQVAAAPGLATKYQYAIDQARGTEAEDTLRPGWDAAVIPDADLLAVIQPMQ